MGCDIHMHIEVKIDGRWEHLTSPDIARNYSLFSRMAGVRQDTRESIEPISYPRGLPGDCNALTKLESDRWGTDGHSHSWLSFDEIKTIVDGFGIQVFVPLSQFSAPFGTFLLGNYVQHKESWIEYVEDVRFVFWFDN